MKTFQILLVIALAVGNIMGQTVTTFTVHNNYQVAQKITIQKLDYPTQEMIEFHTTEIGASDLSKVQDPFVEPSIYLLTSDQGINLRVAVEKPGGVHIILSKPVVIESTVARPSNFPDVIQSLNQQLFSELITRYDQAAQDQDQAEIEKLEQEKNRLLKVFVESMEEKVREMGVSSLAYDALPYFDIHKNYDFLQEMNLKFQQELPESGMSESLRRRMEKAALFAIGNKAPNFMASSMEGSKVSVQDFRGSVLLVDFWASWCRACRVENPKFVDLHYAYKSQGFDVVSISIDEDADSWKKAIDTDGLTWTQILDTNHELYNLFMLSSLPSNFLLNPEGIIIAKNVDGELLRERLMELLAEGSNR